MVYHHLFINTYHHRRLHNSQQDSRIFQKLEFQNWSVLNIFDKNGIVTVILGSIDKEQMIFELITQFKVNFLMTKSFKNHKNRLFSK